MLTFDKLLSAYTEYLSTDTDIEIITARHGYLGLTWDNERGTLDDTVVMKTPKEMKKFILDSYETQQQILLTKGKRDMTAEEVAKVKVMVREMSGLCR